MKNCCQQPGICPAHRICKPSKSAQRPWKRYTCDCKPGYVGNNCDKPTRSCGGYLNGKAKSGKHIIVDSNSKPHEVYCHFDSDGAWTLVMSSNFLNHVRSNSVFRAPLTEDHPVNNDAVEWNNYRLSKARMASVIGNSVQIRFTCDFEKVEDLILTDYLQMSLDQLAAHRDVTSKSLNKNIQSYQGTINRKDLAGCEIRLHQSNSIGLHVHIESDGDCSFTPTLPSDCDTFCYFSYFPKNTCTLSTHRCSQHGNSTSQLWFGETPQDK